MKNSKKYAPKLDKVYSSLKRKHGKVEKISYDDPIEAVVYAIISEGRTTSMAKTMMRKMKSYFVDFNDLRVSRNEEILEILGIHSEADKAMANCLTESLNAVFSNYDMVSLISLHEMGKRQGRQELEKIKSLSTFVINYVVLTALGGHAIPMTAKMINYLKSNELVHPDSDPDDIVGFLERQIVVTEAYGFYVYLRNESETRTVVKKTAKKKTAMKKAPAKKTAVKKTVKTAKKKVTIQNSKKKTSKRKN